MSMLKISCLLSCLRAFDQRPKSPIPQHAARVPQVSPLDSCTLLRTKRGLSR